MGNIDIIDSEEDLHPMGSKPYSPRYPVYHGGVNHAGETAM